jgi:hypothetical protein
MLPAPKILTKAIIADPLRLYELGLRNLMDMAILVHIGRCGLVGTTRKSISEILKVSYDTARCGVDRLQDLKLVTPASRDHGPGSAYNMVCTVRGWNLLTQPADFSMFTHSQIALQKNVTRQKSRQEPQDLDEEPAARAAGIPLEHGGEGGNDDHPEDTGAGALAQRQAGALGGEAQGDAGGAGTGEADDAEPAARLPATEADGV